MSWQELPYHFKRDVVLKLLHKTRCRLQLCSKEEKNLVDSCPILLELVYINPVNEDSSNKIRILYKERYPLYEESGGPTQEIFTESEAAEKFLQLFKGSQSLSNNVTILKDDSNSHFLSELEQKVEKQKIKLRAKSLKLLMNDGEKILKFLKFFESSCLEKLYLDTRTLPQSALNSLVKTEQWKKLKRIEMYYIHPTDIKLDSFLHVNKLVLSVKHFSAKDAFKIFKNFQDRNLPIGSYFIILKNTLFDEKENWDILQKIQEEKKGFGARKMGKPYPVSCYEKRRNLESKEEQNTESENEENAESEEEENSESEEELSEKQKILNRVRVFKMEDETKVLIIDVFGRKFSGFVCSFDIYEYSYFDKIRAVNYD